MNDSEKNIRKIDAKKFKRKIRAHSMWNSEGVIELFNSMLIKEDGCDKCVMNTDHGKVCKPGECVSEGKKHE